MPYHHGDLRNALVSVSTELARAGGPSAVTVRAAARAAGVSATAAYRHFADQQDLLLQTRFSALTWLSRAMNAELAAQPSFSDPVSRAMAVLVAIARGYLNFALAEPGLFRTVFCEGATPPPSDIPVENPFARLTEALDDLVASGYLPASRRPLAELTAWSWVHGFALLLLDGPLSTLSALEREEAFQRGLEITAAGLGAPPLLPSVRQALFRG